MSMETSLIGKALNFGFSDYRFESYVSNYIKNRPHLALLNRLYLANIRNLLFFDLPYTKNISSLLQMLISLGVVKNYYRIRNSQLRIFLFYFNNNLKKSIKIFFKKRNPITFSLETLKSLKYNILTTAILLETSRGFLTYQDAMYLKEGGTLRMIIF